MLIVNVELAPMGKDEVKSTLQTLYIVNTTRKSFMNGIELTEYYICKTDPRIHKDAKKYFYYHHRNDGAAKCVLLGLTTMDDRAVL